MNLDLVLGMSCNNIGSLACDQNTGLVAHTASGVLVVLDTKTNCQVKYFHVRKNCVSSASFSRDGRYVTTGETGYRPAVRVWRIKDGQEVATLYGHEFGIKCVQFCPTMTQIVSVGLEHDNVINVWSWPSGKRMAVNNIVDVLRAVAFSECGNFFVTAGCRHIKFWYPKMTTVQSKTNESSPEGVQPLYGRLGILGSCKDHTFIDVACGNGASCGSVFAITRAGGLVILSAKDRQLQGHKNIVGVKGTCMKVHDRVLFIGFNNGDIHIFNVTTLTHLGALPVPAFFRSSGLNDGGVFTLSFNLSTSYLTTAYKNSSMCVWDLQDAGNVKQKYVAVYHSDAIAYFDVYSNPDPLYGGVRETLVTVGQDSTLRLWGVLIDQTICYDKLSIFYADDSTGSFHKRPSNRTLVSSGVITAAKVSPDQRYIVTGNKEGAICVYNKDTYAHRYTVKAHTREVTALAFYANASRGHLAVLSGSRDRLVQVMDAAWEFRVTCTLHIHSSSITAIRVCSHGGAIRILSCATDRSVNVCEMCAPISPSCRYSHPTSQQSPYPSRAAPATPGTSPHASQGVGVGGAQNNATSHVKAPYRRLSTFHLVRSSAYVSSPMDMAVDHKAQEMAVGFQDGNIRVLGIPHLQEKRAFPGCGTAEAQINKVHLDSHGALLLAAASDKTISVINFVTGHILHTVTGHNKSVTGLVFTSNGNHAISTSMDGCVFLWRLTPDLIDKRREIRLSAKEARTWSTTTPATKASPANMTSPPMSAVTGLAPPGGRGSATRRGRGDRKLRMSPSCDTAVKRSSFLQRSPEPLMRDWVRRSAVSAPASAPLAGCAGSRSGGRSIGGGSGAGGRDSSYGRSRAVGSAGGGGSGSGSCSDVSVIRHGRSSRRTSAANGPRRSLSSSSSVSLPGRFPKRTTVVAAEGKVTASVVLPSTLAVERGGRGGHKKGHSCSCKERSDTTGGAVPGAGPVAVAIDRSDSHGTTAGSPALTLQGGRPSEPFKFRLGSPLPCHKTSSATWSSPPTKPHRQSWRSLVNTRRTHDAENARRKMNKMSSC